MNPIQLPVIAIPRKPEHLIFSPTAIYAIYLNLSYQPAIILPAIHDVVNVHRLILNLIEDQIPFLHEHLVVFIQRYKFRIQKRKTLRHS